MLAKTVFFGVILYQQCKLLVLEEGEKWRGMEVPTACTDGKHIVLSLPFFSGMTLEERVFVMAHEVVHAMAGHPKRAKYYQLNGLCGRKFSPELYNIAADAVINRCLIDDGIGKMPEDGIIFHRPLTKADGTAYTITGRETPEDVYEIMLESVPEDNEGSGGSGEGGPGEGEGEPGKGQEVLDGAGGSGTYEGDVVTPDNATESEINDLEMKTAITSAAKQAQAMGQLPASMKSFIDEFMDPGIPWEEHLRMNITSHASPDHYDWSRPNRRKLLAGMVIPRRTGSHSGHIVCVIDSSGSVGGTDLSHFLGAVSSILTDVRPEKLTVIWCDARVDRVDEVDSPEELVELTRAEGIPGRGGTSFIPPFEYVRDNIDDAACMIYLTDGWGPFPEDGMVACPTIWVINSDVVGPFGTTVHIDTSGRM